MTIQDITAHRNMIQALLKEQRLHDSFKELKAMLYDNEFWEFTEELNRLETSYKYMIQFFISGSNDPQRGRIYNDIVESLYTLADRINAEMSRNVSSDQYFILQRLTPKFIGDLKFQFDNYFLAKSKLDLYDEVPEAESSHSERIKLLQSTEDCENRLFNYIWTRFPMSKADVGVLEEYLTGNESIPSHLKSLIAAAVYLNTSKYYQESLIALLLSLYNSCSEHDVKIAALCYAIILICKYDYRVRNSQTISNIINTLSEDEFFCKDVRTIVFMLIRARDTERLTKRVHDELMPEIMKISPSIIKKFKADVQSLNDPTDFEGNPEWQNILDNSGIAKKIEELNEIQMQGGDVFLSTFAKLKSFPFFSMVSNWFLPFHDNQSIVLDVFTKKEQALKEIISNARFLCNSDKYSFCLSLRSVPMAQREMMMSQFDAQNAAIQELKKTSLPDPAKEHEAIANKVIQDLFRFSRLNRYKSEFYDPFSADINMITAAELLQPIVNDKDSLILLGEYFMKNEHFREAIGCFQNVIDNFNDYLPQIAQKAGFCHQCLKEYDKAIEAYEKYDLFNPDDIWNLRHLAACHRAKGNTAKALEYYRKVEAVSPENIPVCLNIGHCMLELGDTEEALKAYYKVDYLDTKKHRAIRPIAWCAFLLGNHNLSHDYYQKVINDNPTAQDYLNMGHLALCEHKYDEALSCYQQSVQLFGAGLDIFLQNFDNDIIHLREKGISDIEIHLIIDKLYYITQQ